MAEIHFLSGLLGAQLDSIHCGAEKQSTVQKRTTFWYLCTCMFARASSEQSGVVGANNRGRGSADKDDPTSPRCCYVPQVPRDRCVSDASWFHYSLPPQSELAHWPIFQARSRTVRERQVGELRCDFRHREQIAKCAKKKNYLAIIIFSNWIFVMLQVL